MRVLLVEDDELLGNQIVAGLGEQGHTIDWLQDGQTAQYALQAETFDIIILDLGLPRLSGFGLLELIRNEGNVTPVIILTAQGSSSSLIKGLDSGADDYLTKPFDMNELGARVRALIRRSTGRADKIIRYRNITLEPAAHIVKVNDKFVNIPRREFALLHKLLESVGKVVPREKLIQNLYGWEENVDSNALEVHIHNLRKKLNADFLRTVRGVGYMIAEESEDDH